MLQESCSIKLNSEAMIKSYLYGVGVDYLTEEMDADPELAKKFLEFFNSKGESEDCTYISDTIEAAMKKKYGLKNHDRLKNIIKNTVPSQCKILYENFWSAPLEARSVINARILGSVVNSDNDDPEENLEQEAWERIFDVVMDTLIKPEDTSIEAKYSCDIMHSYIKSRSVYERELILSAMMVANRNIGEDAGNVGKALKLFLENMGPAEIKLGQAIASHPDTPESIQKELQGLKNSARVAARWTIYDWIRAENIPEELWKDKYLGEVLGAASYYTSVAIGDDEVLRLLVPEAREKAAKGFKVIGFTIEDLRAKDAISELSYQELTASVQEMVKQAARMSHIETDHEIGEVQCESAKDIYNGVTIKCGDRAFPLKVMDWNAKGQNWIFMKRAKGKTFNALPEKTPEQRAYKKSFAKSYIVFELVNILSGKKFDHDKHGDQLCVDEDTNEVGIFDTGAMALEDPSERDQHMLGTIIYDVLSKMMTGQDSLMSFSQIISDRIDGLHSQGIDTQYLVEVKKGLLALGDFFKILDEDDIKDILPSIDLFSDLSEHVQAGITENMSMSRVTQLKFFSAAHKNLRGETISIHREQVETAPSNVLNFSVQPNTREKSGWLHKAFDNSENDGDPDLSGFVPINDSYGVTEIELTS